MKKTIKKGSSDFKTIIEDNGYFVDKTMLIKEFFENGNYILLMPRPKRFGKTLNLSMIEHFFDIQKSNSKKLFSDFEITTEKEFCEKHQNKYPVINISLKGIKETNRNTCLDKFKSLISDLYKKYRFLLQTDKLEKDEKQIISSIILETASVAKYKDSLKFLSNYLKKYFSRKVILLVDEYDAPIISAFNNTNSPIKSNDKENKTYYENVISFMQGFPGEAYKGNDDLKKGLLTGVMRVGRESIFSEWNNFEVYGITSTYFADSFGFTQKEIDKLLNYFDLGKDKQKISKWYNGYKFGNITQIYNPWAIVSYVLNYKAEKYNKTCHRFRWQNTLCEKKMTEKEEAYIIKLDVILFLFFLIKISSNYYELQRFHPNNSKSTKSRC